MMELEGFKHFTDEEVEDILKNKDNLVYLFEPNGTFIRLDCSTKKDLFTTFL